MPRSTRQRRRDASHSSTRRSPASSMRKTILPSAPAFGHELRTDRRAIRVPILAMTRASFGASRAETRCGSTIPRRAGARRRGGFRTRSCPRARERQPMRLTIRAAREAARARRGSSAPRAAVERILTRAIDARSRARRRSTAFDEHEVRTSPPCVDRSVRKSSRRPSSARRRRAASAALVRARG